MKGIPVVVSPFGLPVKQVEDGAPLMTVSDNGFGLPIRLSDRGFPFIVEGLAPESEPVNTSVPTISGTEQVGETLTATTGTWTNSPDSYAYQWQRNTGTWEDITGATGSTYTLVEADEGNTVRVEVIATNGAGSSDPAYSVATGAIQPPVTPSAIQYGRTPDFDGGTDFDYIVDPSGGGDYTTISDALTAATALPGPVSIGVRAGEYREQYDIVSYAGAGITLSSYGTEQPVMCGSLNVPGFTVCDISDEPVVGPNYASIYKATIAKSAIQHVGYSALLVRENGELLDLVQRRQDETDLFILDEYATYFDNVTDGCSATVDVDGHIETITHPAVLGAYSDTALAQSVVALWVTPNLTQNIKVASASGGVLTMAANTATPESSGSITLRYSLLNILPAMVQGQWGFVDDGGSNLTLYVWPNNTADLDKIDIAARQYCLVINASQNITVQGLTLEHTASAGGTYGSPIRIQSGSTDTTVQECKFQYVGFENLGGGVPGRGYGAVYSTNSDRTHFLRSTFRKGQSVFGHFMVGGDECRAMNLLIEDVTQSPVRNFGCTNTAIVDVRPIRCGQGAHANLINFYNGGDELLIIGYNPPLTLADRPAKGYATVQTSSRSYWLHSIFPMGPDGRAFVDQTNSNEPPTNPSENYIVNCLIPYDPVRIGTMSGYTAYLGNPNYELNWTLANCVLPSEGPLNSGRVGTVTRLNNILTYQDPDNASEDRVDPLAIFYDPSVGDFRTLPGSLWLTKAGEDQTALIEALAVKFPDLADRLYKDIDGNDWNPEAPGVGPWGGETPVVDGETTAPVISNIETLDNGSGIVTITLDTDEAYGYLHYELDDGENTVTGTQWVDTTGEQTIVVTDLLEGTYDVSVYHVDRFQNTSNTLTDTVEVAAGGGDPTEWLVSTGGYFVDPSGAIPSGVTVITGRGKFRFNDLSGTFSLFSQESTGLDLRCSNNTWRFIAEDGDGTAVINAVNGSIPALSTGVWYTIQYTVDQTAKTATMTINGTPYTLAFTTPGNGVFQTGREVSFLAFSNGTNVAPSGTEVADPAFDFNEVEYKAISNTAATANADSWKLPVSPTSDFTQGV